MLTAQLAPGVGLGSAEDTRGHGDPKWASWRGEQRAGYRRGRHQAVPGPRSDEAGAPLAAGGMVSA